MMADTYADYLKKPHWQKLRSERLLIDDFTCQKCGSKYFLQVHHLTYQNIGHENPYTDLITLCSICHKKIEQAKKAQKIRDFVIQKYGSRDKPFGGDLNLCHVPTIKKAIFETIEISELDVAELVDATFIINHFKLRRYKDIYRNKKRGAPYSWFLANRNYSNHMLSIPIEELKLKIKELEDYFNEQTKQF